MISRQGDEIVMTLHSTNILYFKPNGVVTLNCGGWRSQLTLGRMNQFIGPHLSIRGYNSTKVDAVQITKARFGHYGEDYNLWKHKVTYDFENGMSFDLSTGVYVWDPFTWTPMEFASGMFSLPIIHAIDNLEGDINEAVRLDRITNEFMEQVVARREQIEITFNKARTISEQDIHAAQVRIATTLTRTLELFAAKANAKLGHTGDLDI